MAGETDVEEYTDQKFYPEHDWQLDLEIREIARINNDPDDKKPLGKYEPYYRCRHVDESRKKR